MTRYVVVDTETTGLDTSRDRVIWIAVAVLENDGVNQRWSTFLDSGTGSRTYVNGTELVGHFKFADITPKLTELLSKGVLVAHNAAFDHAFLAAEYARAGSAMPEVPMICTLRLAQRHELAVSSFSLVACCAHFGISHLRRHHAEEDVEATVQLLLRLLPLASARGWDDTQTLQHVLAATTRSGRGDLSYTIEINIEQMLAERLIEKVGWRPGDEPVEDAWVRYGKQLRAEREAAYAKMQPEHRAAHQLKDTLNTGDTRAAAWLPVLEALETAGCPEAPDTWVEYAKRVQGPKRNAKRAVKALRRALELYFSCREPSRTRINDAITWLDITCTNANLPDELIDAYCSWGQQLAALPPCGECGDVTSGCHGEYVCETADLASRASRAVFHSDFNLNESESENPELVERRARTVLSLLAQESNPAAYAELAFKFSQRLVSWSRPDDALTVWHSIIARAADHECAGLAKNSDRLARTFAAVKRYGEAITIARSAVEMARRLTRPEIFWWASDSLGSCLERVGRLEEAKQYWFQAVDAGSDITNTFDRLSLALERAADYSTAAHICQIGWGRFSKEVRRYKYAEKIQQRGERCRAKLRKSQVVN